MGQPACGTGHGTRQWVNLEPCGLFCGMVTWLLLAYGMYATTTCVIQPWLGFGISGSLHAILFNAMSIVAIYSHFAAMTTDPGAVPRECMPLPDDVQELDYERAAAESQQQQRAPYRKFCNRCKAFKPLRAHHCSVCNRCIIKMDHHCPWVNNCVGIGNHKLFLLFLLWVNLVCAYALVLCISKYMFCQGASCGSSSQNLLSVFLLVEASLFGLFTVCMMGDQSSVLVNNQTKIDALKGVKNNTGVEDFNEVFGCSTDVAFSVEWLIPVPAKFPEGEVRDKLMGYCAPCCGSGDESAIPLTGSGGDLEMATSSAIDDNDLARQRLGSTELWGLSELSPPSSSDSGQRGGPYSVRRRSGPPF